MASDQKSKKRKKNEPDNLQPDLVHPPHQQNPVLTPKPVSEKRKREEKQHHDTSAKPLHHESLDVPIKPAPPGILLTLVGAFLTSYGFHDTLRQYTTELASRKKLNAWPIELETKLPNGFPDLVTIYEDRYKEYQKKTQPDPTSIGSGDSRAAKVVQLSKKKGKQEKAFDAGVEETSSSGISDSSDDSSSESSSESSSAEDDSDVEMKDAIQAKIERQKRLLPSSSSTSSSTSDSDADDEEEATAKKALSIKKDSSKLSTKSKQKSSSKPSSISDLLPHSNPSSLIEKKHNTKITPQSSEAVKITTSKNIEKRQLLKASKAASSSSSSSSSTSSSSESSEDEKLVANPKPQAKTKSTPSAASISSPSSSDEEIPPPPKFKASRSTKKLSKTPSNSKLELPISKSATDSSVTLDVSSPIKPSAHPTAVTLVRSTDAAPTSSKRPYPTSPDDEATTVPAKKPRNVPFQRVPSDTKVDPKLASNAYRGHDYGDKAHNDLSVTRGKGFTKEKNKKKRGSYRGGVIDVTGGKGIKFDD